MLLISPRQLLFLYIGFAFVYISGLFIPLMENDSAQHASMAMRMVLNKDFFTIYKGENPYLDKPHLHFWLAAISMKIFGINHIAYRIPALLALLLGAFSTKKLAYLLYKNENTSHVASLIFLSAQTIILSAHDVRTDAVLTGFIIFSIWQFVKFIQSQYVINAILAGLGTALAFSSKGLMAVVIIGLCIFSYLLYSKEWKNFFNRKIFFVLIFFIIGITPVLYAYQHQFGGEGIKFILFNQSLNRLTANGFKETSPDYFFFFHTLLWAFLPFSLAFYFGVFEKTAFFIKNKFKKIEGVEFLTLGGFWMVMMVFSVSKFKLPHYLNGLIAVLAILTSSYLFDIYRRNCIKK
ncbi:ArnT family glycosyltransferase [Chryseobacterium wanjuense]